MLKKSLLTILFILSLATQCSAQITLEYPINEEVIESPCEDWENISFTWHSTYPKPSMFFMVKVFNSTGGQMSSSSTYNSFIEIPLRNLQENTYRWTLSYMTREEYLYQRVTYDEYVWPDIKEASFNVVCTPIPEEEPDDNEEILPDEEETTPIPITNPEVKSEVITPKEPIIKKQEKFLPTVQKKIEKITTDIKDVFVWDRYVTKIVLNMIIDLFNSASKIEIPKKEEIAPKIITKKTKPFIFPFKKIIGVTQWHGNTAFQKPHTGIDFGATKETIISPGDGKVVALGWDSFNGKCFSGGNYLVIKHTNDMHTSYMHIEKYLVKNNEEVKEGQKIAISGRSGKWNCQNLKYHLHFETRKERSQTTHVNPVEYIETDWSKIPTLGYENNRGRLSGDNPHPTY